MWRMADVAVGVFEAARRSEPVLSGGGAHDLMVHVDLASLRKRPGEGPAGVLDDGTLLDPSVIRRMACDSGVVFVARDEQGNTIDVGRRTRTIPSALRRALHMRDQGCRFPGCCNRRHVDGHHVKHWIDGGETKLGNLISLCRFHHRLVHEQAFEIRIVDGDFEFVDPRGKIIDRVPMRPIEAALVHAPCWPDPRLEPRKLLPRWDGSRVDYGWAIEGLMRAAPRRESRPRPAIC